MRKTIKVLLGLEKVLVFLAAFFIIVWFFFEASIFQGNFLGYFLITGNIEDMIIVVVFFFIVNYILRKLLMWTYRTNVKRI